MIVPFFVNHNSTMDDLVYLDMVEFDVILLSSCILCINRFHRSSSKSPYFSEPVMQWKK